MVVPGGFSLEPLITEARRRARRRRWVILLALVGALASAASALELRTASGSGVSAGGRPVLHVVLQWPPSTAYFDLKTGRKTVKTSGEEMWTDGRPNGWHRVVSTEGGRPVADQVWRARYGPKAQAAAVDRFYRSLVMDYRAALLSGRVELAGRGTFEGHHVDWLRVTPHRDDRWYVLRELGEVGVDARTYKPILIRSHSGKRYVYERILSAQAIAYDAADFKKSHTPRNIPAFHGQLAVGYDFGTPAPGARHSSLVRSPWLTAGTTVAGLRLRAVTPFTIRKTKHRFSYGAPRPKPIHGLALVYGPAAAGTPSLPTPVNVYGRPKDARATTRFTIVYELPQAPRTPPWFLVPHGSIEVQSGYTTAGTHVVPTPWIGYLRKRGLYITITTPLGERIPPQIARSLHSGT